MPSLPTGYFLYRILMMLLSPVLLIWAWRTAQTPEQRQSRLGKMVQPVTADIWIHCASIGEVNAAMTLVKLLLAQNTPFMITCFTPSGLAQAQARLAVMRADHIPCSLLPIDWHWTTKRFLSNIKVKELWLLETELWPMLLLNAKQQGIRLKLINGRLSSKTLEAPRWWRNLLAHLLTYTIGTCLIRSEQDKRYYETLGVMPEKLQVTGNLKHCDMPESEPIRLYHSPYIVLASSHAPEELELARIWQQHPTLPKLVIVPRHPKRGTHIIEQLTQAGILCSQLSQQPDHYKGVVIADTFGQLLSWMAFAELVIIGGSFAPKGGQNPVEAARLGRSMITGPDMHDFAEEAEVFAQLGVLHTCAHIDEQLIQQIKQILKHPASLSEQGQLAQAWVTTSCQQVLHRTALALGLQMDTHPSSTVTNIHTSL